jgi:hypothetical protein
MGMLFAVGSLCFLVGPLPAFLEAVGPRTDAIVFVVGSLFFTAAATLQMRGSSGRGRARGLDWWSSAVQLLGTLFFNVTTTRALATSAGSSHYDRLVWRPDAFGSTCFLISGLIAYRASARHGWRPARGAAGWWQSGINLLGCILFGVAAVAGYLVPSSGTALDLAAANWTTSAGAACFLACALGSLRPADTPPPRGTSPQPGGASAPPLGRRWRRGGASPGGVVSTIGMALSHRARANGS